MKKTDQNITSESFFDFLFNVSAFRSLKSIFENDSSNIVSMHGKSILSDEKEMKKVIAKIKEAEANHENEVII